MPEMAPEAMDALSFSVRRLRALLEDDLARQLDRRFRLSVPAAHAGLDAKELALRTRLDGWLAERARARHTNCSDGFASTMSVESDMASNALLRLFLLRQLEACGVSRPPVLSGGWNSKGYLEFRSYGAGLTDGQGRDEYEGLDFLLKLLFEELAIDLPGLYGKQPLDAFFTLSPAALREMIAVLNAPELATAWQDDTMLGWVYQFWNDPQREAIDERVGPRGKVFAREIASKTQLFTEQYMVEWLLQNSLGRIALAMRQARIVRLASPSQVPPPWPMFVHNAASLNGNELPASLSELKVLDPACGSGHFLAGAFDLLVPLYREEARDNGVEIPDARIADNILRHNLHGIDIDGRAVQVAAAVLYLKARRLAPRGLIPPMNLVSTEFDLDGLAIDDPALAALARALPNGRADVAEAVRALRHVGVRGSLMRFRAEQAAPLPVEDSAPNVGIERFLTTHTKADDLGVRFDGTQLAAGFRLQSFLVEGRYDVVVLNPPYLATSKIDLPSAVLAEAFGDSPDLFAAFVQRALELCKPTGLMAFVALSNWMFLSSFRDTRERMLAGHILLLADLGKGAFRRASKLIQSAMVVASPRNQPKAKSLAARVGSRDTISAFQTVEIANALRDQGSYTPFDPGVFARVEGAPLLFWLDPEFMRRYAELPKIDRVAECKGGIATSNNERFLRAIWEVPLQQAKAAALGADSALVPYLKGAEGREWIEPYRWLLCAEHSALELRVLLPTLRVEPAAQLGVAYTTIGHRFGTRLHTVASVRDVSGASVFPTSEAVSAEALVCALNRSVVRDLASALNPTVNFQLGDVRRLPFDAVAGATEIVAALRATFARHERGSELSIDYIAPDSTAWGSAQIWAQTAVDRRIGAPIAVPNFAEEPAPPWHSISHGLGIALGRFMPGAGIAAESGGGLPDGLLLLGPASSSLNHEACSALRSAWAESGPALETKDDLASYLRKSFFADHRSLYEGRPIHFPLSSVKRAYVAYVCIHSLRSDTLSILLAEHLVPEKRRVEGELADLRGARQEGRAKATVEKRFTEVQKLLEELEDFIAKVSELADKGPPSSDSKTARREVDARYAMDLDDGVLVNSAALWPLLEPQWKEPKKWWKELANAEAKDYDWSHLAARYFPTRVRQKCHDDPSLAVAHHCFWELHPDRAYAWELRLQDEIRPDFTIDEPGSDAARARFVGEHAREAREIRAKELKRRERKSAQADELDEPLLNRLSDEPDEASLLAPSR
jgi:hypothetical protein